nr:hypothetical protein [uncultured Methanoregula sp.]
MEPEDESEAKYELLSYQQNKKTGERDIFLQFLVSSILFDFNPRSFGNLHFQDKTMGAVAPIPPDMSNSRRPEGRPAAASK